MKNGGMERRFPRRPSNKDGEDFRMRRRRKRSYSDGYLTVPPNFAQLVAANALDALDCDSKTEYRALDVVGGEPSKIKLAESGNRKPGLISDLKRFVTTKMLQKRRSQSIDANIPLRFAIRNREVDRVRFMLETSSVDVNEKNDRGITVTHEAAFDGYLDILKLLVEHGANVNKEDNEGFTCLDYAVLCGHFECSSYLIDNGAKDDHVRNGIDFHLNTPLYL